VYISQGYENAASFLIRKADAWRNHAIRANEKAKRRRPEVANNL
jgi:hypothetical protein